MNDEQRKKVEHFVYRIDETTNPKTQWVTDVNIKNQIFDITLGMLYIDNIRLEDDTLVILYYNRPFRIKVTDDMEFDIIKLSSI